MTAQTRQARRVDEQRMQKNILCFVLDFHFANLVLWNLFGVLLLLIAVVLFDFLGCRPLNILISWSLLRGRFS